MGKLKNVLQRVIVVVLIWFFESAIQILYFAIVIKYFDKFSSHSRFEQIVLDAGYFVSQMKLVFYLPVYLFFYFNLPRPMESALRIATYHAMIFAGISSLLALFMPWHFFRSIEDALFLIAISFSTTFLFILSGSIIYSRNKR